MKKGQTSPDLIQSRAVALQTPREQALPWSVQPAPQAAQPSRSFHGLLEAQPSKSSPCQNQGRGEEKVRAWHMGSDRRHKGPEPLPLQPTEPSIFLCLAHCRSQSGQSGPAGTGGRAQRGWEQFPCLREVLHPQAWGQQQRGQRQWPQPEGNTTTFPEQTLAFVITK